MFYFLIKHFFSNMPRNTLISDIKEIKSILNNIDKELFRQHHDIYGNGKKGMIERIEELEEDNKKINKKIACFSGIIALFSSSINYLINFVKGN